MRICSFLPSATEMLFALGAGDDVVGVSFECDYPPGARERSQVVFSHMPTGLRPEEIDALVRETGAQGRNLYWVDLQALRGLQPDLIVAQDLCSVCALDTPTILRDLRELEMPGGAPPPPVISLSAHSLAEVLADIERLGDITGHAVSAQALTARLRTRVERVRASRRSDVPKPRVLCLEWLQPLFQGGHWIPEMIELAGGTAVLADPGEKSRQLGWDEVAAAAPDVIVVMPCGYHLEETLSQFRETERHFPAVWTTLPAVQRGQVYAVDGSAYFSRPGPRLIDGLEILAEILRGESFEREGEPSFVPLPSRLPAVPEAL